MSNIALAASGLTCKFGAFTALNQVSLSIPEGARHAIIGPNGAGKTTLVNVLTGALSPTAGTITVNGESFSKLGQPQRVRRNLTRTFQINACFRGLSVLENVLLAIVERERLSSQFWRPIDGLGRHIEEAHEMLRFANLADDAKKRVRELPYGKQRLLEIAIALATKPRILILDEPAAGVPSEESGAIFERLAALPRDVTLIFIEHDMGLVFRFAQQITVLVSGCVLTEGTPREIASDARVREVYLGNSQHAVA